jgi:translation initiation factor 4E
MGEPEQEVTMEEPVQLENSWCFYHDKYLGPAQSMEEYEASLQKLCTFSTIQDFWKNFNNLPPIDKLKVKSSFHLMKAGIRPIWEDPENANGGFWAVRVRREDTEQTWKELVLAAIGEQFGPVLSNEDDICGVTVSLRQYDNIIQVWNSNASANVNAVLARIKSIVPNVEFRNPFYKAHREHSAFNSAKTQSLKK